MLIGAIQQNEKVEFAGLIPSPGGKLSSKSALRKPIWMTDEERRNVPITNTVRKKVQSERLYILI